MKTATRQAFKILSISAKMVLFMFGMLYIEHVQWRMQMCLIR